MDVMVLPGLVTGLSLLLSGGLKAGRAERLGRAFEDLRVPAALSGRWAVLGLVPVEVVLGAAVLLVPAPLAVLPAAVATLLLAAYAVLVARVVVRREDASCACFGVEEQIGPTTVLRNVLLVAAGALATVDALRGHDPLHRLLDLPAGGWGWLAGTLLVAGLVLLATPRPGTRTPTGPDVRGIPYLVVKHPDGTVTSLPELASLRPQLLVHLSTTCRHCSRVAEALSGWVDRLPEVDLRVLTTQPAGDGMPATWVGVLHDPEGQVASVLGLVRPSAVLLGADALIAAGPVHGPDAILDLLAEMERALGQAPEVGSTR